MWRSYYSLCNSRLIDVLVTSYLKLEAHWMSWNLTMLFFERWWLWWWSSSWRSVRSSSVSICSAYLVSVSLSLSFAFICLHFHFNVPFVILCIHALSLTFTYRVSRFLLPFRVLCPLPLLVRLFLIFVSYSAHVSRLRMRKHRVRRSIGPCNLLFYCINKQDIITVCLTSFLPRFFLQSSSSRFIISPCLYYFSFGILVILLLNSILLTAVFGGCEKICILKKMMFVGRLRKTAISPSFLSARSCSSSWCTEYVTEVLQVCLLCLPYVL